MSTIAPEPDRLLALDTDIEEAISRITERMRGEYPISRRAVALLLLEDDAEITDLVRHAEGEGFAAVADIIAALRSRASGPLDAEITIQRREAAQRLSSIVMGRPQVQQISFNERLSRLCMYPITGLPILAFVLWFGLYQFVGVFGGKTLVGLLEDNLFGKHINPWMVAQVRHLIPWTWLSDLFVGEYGMWTLGVTYATALIFPIVGTFFLAFSVLEDSGYFPRLAMLIDRIFKSIGLNGKAVIPIVLGFGCDTMATIVTRILETPRERIIATFLLSLAIPCSAQIGVMTVLLAGHPRAFAFWVGIMTVIFLLIGYLTAKLLPGETARFAMEIPPLRIPSLSNIAVKTFARVQWYFLEVFPLFLFASFIIWIGRLTGLFEATVHAMRPIMRLLGLPDQTAEAFLFGFFRRDYGAAGLYRLQQNHMLTGNQLLVSVVTLTIFLPCIAQFLMMKKERGLAMALGMAAFIFPFAIVVGATLNLLLGMLHVRV
ncbi:MAG: nucleoside recognition domain-containing protein [Chthonomonadales bacterium]